MSKTAILISGHMRTFARCLPTQHWHVFRKFPNPAFFVSTVKDRDSDSAELLRKYYPNAQIEIEVVDAQPEIPLPVQPLDPTWTVGRMYSHEPYGISVHPQAVLRQLWQLDRCWTLFVERSAAVMTVGGDGKTVDIESDFDTIIRIRPDLWFRNFVMPNCIITLPDGTYGFALDKRNPFVSHASTPYWGRFGGINDRLAILGVKAAQAYFTTFSQMKALISDGCPLHPESLIKASLQKSGCTVNDTLICEFSKLYGPENAKLNGTFRDPEITMQDLANLAARK